MKGRSKYPRAVGKIGSYPAFPEKGGGFLYDEVLEYRVWVKGDEYYYKAFDTYEDAQRFHKATKRSERPYALVLQEKGHWLGFDEEGNTWA